MVHLFITKLNSKEIDKVPVTGTPVGSRTEIVNSYKLNHEIMTIDFMKTVSMLGQMDLI